MNTGDEYSTSLRILLNLYSHPSIPAVIKESHGRIVPFFSFATLVYIYTSPFKIFLYFHLSYSQYLLNYTINIYADNPRYISGALEIVQLCA